MIGKVYEPFTMDVEKGRLCSFAKAIGETNPIYFNEAAAVKAGYRSIPAPPTFPFVAAMEAEQPFVLLADMGIDKRKTVHGEQQFTYLKPIVAGDVLTGQQKVVEMYDKKGGALTFIVTETRLTNQLNEAVCDMRTVIVVRNG